jgi:hypothetical protein
LPKVPTTKKKRQKPQKQWGQRVRLASTIYIGTLVALPQIIYILENIKLKKSNFLF